MTNLLEMLCALSALAEERGDAWMALGSDPDAADMFEIMEATERLILLLTKNHDTERLVDRLMDARIMERAP